MKLHELHIEKFRGIVDLTLKFNGHNATIVGHNGTGKSAIVDAIDFLLTGRITRLEGEGTKELKFEECSVHVGYDIKDAKVSAVIEGSSGLFKVSRSLKSKKVTIDEKNKAEFEKMCSYAEKNAQHYLSRRELLKFISSTSSTRSEQIDILIDTKGITKISKGLDRYSSNIEKQYDQFQKQYETDKTNYLRLLNIISEDEALDVVNEKRKILGYGAITDLSKDTILDGISYETDTIENDLCRADRFLNNYLLKIDFITAECREKYQTIIQSVKQIENSLDDDLDDQIKLLNLGIKLQNSNMCPLCGHIWENTQTLTDLLSHKKSDMAIIETSIKEIEKDIDDVVNSVSTFIKSLENIDSLIKRNEELHAFCIKFIKPFIELKKPNKNNLLCFNQFSDALLSCTAERYPISESKIAAKNKIDEIKPSIDLNLKLKDDTYNTLNKTKTCLATISDYESNREKYDSIKNKSKLILSIFNESRSTTLNSIYDAISSDFSDMYRFLHPDENNTFNAVIERSEKKLSFSVDFYGKGMFPPNAVHSEGHQDSMGIVMFLSLMKKFKTEISEFVLLDDVVMSIDIEHRLKLCELLKERFSEDQLIITTHDDVWARELVYNGVVSEKNKIEIFGWDVESGPIIVMQGSNIWDKSKQQANNLNSACAYLRRELEALYSKICDNICASIPYNRRHKWDFGDFFNAAYVQLMKYLDDAKSYAEKNNMTSTVESINSLRTKIKDDRIELEHNIPVMNTCIHYNEIPQSKQELYKTIECLQKYTQNFIPNGKPINILRDSNNSIVAIEYDGLMIKLK